MMKIFQIFLFFCLAAYSLPVLAQDDLAHPQPEASTGYEARKAIAGRSFMIATANPLATRAGYEVLNQGGTAADAAVAVQMVLGLAEPQSSGIGGGAFVLYHDAKSGTLITLDGRETAPKRAKPDMFLRDDGTVMDYYEAVIGGRAVGVPGTVALLGELHGRYGRMPWDTLFRPAIEWAQQGFEISPRLAKHIAGEVGRLDRYQVARAYFFHRDGRAKQAGETLKNPAYADTLKTLAQYGAKGFYKGEIADHIVQAVRQEAKDNPGQLRQSDFRDYRIVERSPVCAPYRSYKICGMGEPSSGGLTVLQILSLLEPLEPQNNANGLHMIAEASRLAFADRNYYMADPAFVDSPGMLLLDPNYVDQRRKEIFLIEAADDVKHGTPPNWPKPPDNTPDASIDVPGTSHISIIDAYGNALSMTTTIEGGFGSRMMVNGFMLNNELTDFSFIPEKDGKAVANRVEGGKRPRSSMAPMIVYNAQDRPVLVLGSAGGSRIIGYVLQRLIAVLDWGMDVQDALNMPNFVHRGRGFELEQGLEGMLMPLAAKGHDVEIRDMNSGLTAIHVKDGALYGAVDPRREGVAMGR